MCKQVSMLWSQRDIILYINIALLHRRHAKTLSGSVFQGNPHDSPSIRWGPDLALAKTQKEAIHAESTYHMSKRADLRQHNPLQGQTNYNGTIVEKRSQASTCVSIYTHVCPHIPYQKFNFWLPRTYSLNQLKNLEKPEESTDLLGTAVRYVYTSIYIYIYYICTFRL